MNELRAMVQKCLIGATIVTGNRRPEDITPVVVDTWLTLAQDKHMTPLEFSEAFKAAVEGTDFFPSWSRVWKAHCNIKGASLRDPVIVGEEDGVLQLGERATCDALGSQYRELRPPEDVQALPMTSAGRTAVKERLSESLARAEAKVLGKPQPRARAEYVEEDEPEKVQKTSL